LFFTFVTAYASNDDIYESSKADQEHIEECYDFALITIEQDDDEDVNMPSSEPESEIEEQNDDADDSGPEAGLPPSESEPEPESEEESNYTIIDTLKESVNTVVGALADAFGIDIEAMSTDITPVSVGAVSYIALDGTEQIAQSAILIDGNLPSTLGVAGTTTWYAVDSNASSNQRVIISGNVNLILEDTHLLTANAGIDVSPGSTLTLWAQVGGSGQLIATAGAQNAGIGGTNGTAGTVIINGGQVTANGGNNGAGIGGGGNGDGGTIIINRGTVNATGGGWGAAGIGGGSANPGGVSGGGRSGAGGSITINGGTVTATGNSSTSSGINNYNVGGGAGVGGAGANNSNTVYGGATTSNGIPSGAGGTITINGGNVTATGGNGYAYYGCGGAGIGSGGAGGYVMVGNDGTIMITSSATISAAGGAGSSSTPGMAGANIGFGGGYSPPNSFAGDNIPTASNIVISPIAPLVGTPLNSTYTYVSGINGSGAQDTQNLSATIYQWYRSAAGITDPSFAPIDGATSSTYTPTGADVGQYLYLMVTVVNTNGVVGIPVFSDSSGQVGLMVSLVVDSVDNNDEATIQDMNPSTNPSSNALTAINAQSQSLIIYNRVNPIAPKLTAIPDPNVQEKIQWTIFPVNGGAFTDTSIPSPTSSVDNPNYQLPTIDANLTQSIIITATFTALEILDVPVCSGFDYSGKITFTPGSNNIGANATYSYTLYLNGTAVPRFMNMPIDITSCTNNGNGSYTYDASGDGPNGIGIANQMLTSAGTYFVAIAATPDSTNSDYLQQSVTSAPSPAVTVFEVRVTTKGMISGDSVDVKLYEGATVTNNYLIATNTTTSIYQFMNPTNRNTNQVWLTQQPASNRVVTWSPGSGSVYPAFPNTHVFTDNNTGVIITFSTPLSAPTVDSFDQTGNITFTPSTVNTPSLSTMTYTYTLYQDGNPVLEFINKPITNFTTDSSGVITYNAGQDGIVTQLLSSPGTYTVAVTARTSDPTYLPTNVAPSQMSAGVNGIVNVFTLTTTIVGNGTDSVGDGTNNSTSSLTTYVFDGSLATLTATPSMNRTAVWTDINGTTQSTMNPFTTSAITADATVVATFYNILAAPTNVKVTQDGMISFIQSANPPSGVTYTYTLYREGMAVSGFTNVPMANYASSTDASTGVITITYDAGGDGPSGSGIVSQLLSSSGTYTIIITATANDNTYLPGTVNSGPSIPGVTVYSVSVTAIGIIGTDSVSISGTQNPTQNATIDISSISNTVTINVFSDDTVTMSANIDSNQNQYAVWTGKSAGVISEDKLVISGINANANATVTFSDMTPLDSPTAVNLSQDGTIVFTPGSNNIAAGGVTYTYTLFFNGSSVEGFIDVPMTGISSPTTTNPISYDASGDGIVTQMLSKSGDYFVEVAAKTTNAAYISPSALSDQSNTLTVYSVDITMVGGNGSDSVSALATSGNIGSSSGKTNATNTYFAFEGDTVTLTASIYLPNPSTNRIVQWTDATGISQSGNVHTITDITTNTTATVTFSTELDAPKVTAFDQSGRITFTPGANTPASNTMAYSYTLHQGSTPVPGFVDIPMTGYTASGGSISYNARGDDIVAKMLSEAGTYSITLTATTTDLSYSLTNTATSQMSTGTTGSVQVYTVSLLISGSIATDVIGIASSTGNIGINSNGTDTGSTSPISDGIVTGNVFANDTVIVSSIPSANRTVELTNTDGTTTSGITTTSIVTLPIVENATLEATFSTIVVEPKIDASINPTTAIFDIFTGSADYHKDIAFTLTPGSYTLAGISLNGDTLQLSQDYIVSGSTITLLASYLDTINIGQNIFTLNMDGGAHPTLTVKIINTEAALDIVDTDHAMFTGTEIVSWKITAPLQSFFRMTQLDEVTHAASVVDQSNFTITEGSTIITMLQSFVKALPNGEYYFRAEFVDGHADLYLTVSTDDQQGGGQDNTNPGNNNDQTNPSNPSTSKTSNQQDKVPQTGVNSNLLLWVALLILALLGTAGTITIICHINRKDILVKSKNMKK